MAILSSEHLLDQAIRLIGPKTAGKRRQVDLRRAISAAYYGVFHATLTAAADEFVGVTKRATPQYALVYRSVDHRALRELCAEIKKPTLPPRYARHEPAKGFSAGIKAFAAALIELQEKRHAADYDPSARMKQSDALLAVATARSALRAFGSAGSRGRKAFLTLLLFPPR